MTTLYFRTSYWRKPSYFLNGIKNDYDVVRWWETDGLLTVKCKPKRANTPHYGKYMTAPNP